MQKQIILDASIGIQKFVKPLIGLGTFTHPVDDWTLKVSNAKLEEWARAFRKMRKNGVKVPLTRSHTFQDDASTTMGYVNDVFVEDGWLMGEIEVRGRDNIEQVQIVDQVSIGLIQDYADGLGNKYKEVVNHVALTSTPVIPGQEGFRVAASIDNHENIIVLKLANIEGEDMNKDFVLSVQEMLNDPDITKDNLPTKVEEKFKSLALQVEAGKEVNKDLSLAQERIKVLESRELPEPDEKLLSEWAKIHCHELDQLVEESRIDLSMASRIKREFLEDPKVNALVLSTYGKRDDSVIKVVMDVLKDLPPRVEFSEQSGSQNLAVVQDDKANSTGDFDPQLLKEMSAMAGIK